MDTSARYEDRWRGHFVQVVACASWSSYAESLDSLTCDFSDLAERGDPSSLVTCAWYAGSPGLMFGIELLLLGKWNEIRGLGGATSDVVFDLLDVATTSASDMASGWNGTWPLQSPREMDQNRQIDLPPLFLIRNEIHQSLTFTFLQF